MDHFHHLATQLLIDSPFLGRLLATLPKREVPGLSGLSSQHSPQLHFELHLGQTALAQGGLPRLKHQLLHLLLRHPFQKADQAGSPYFDLAADLEVDQLLLPSERQFPALPPTLPPTRHRTLANWLHLLQQPNQQATVQELQQRQAAQLAEHQSWLGIARLGAAERRLLERNTRRWLLDTLQQLPAELRRRLPSSWQAHLAVWRAARSPLHWSQVLRRFVRRSRPAGRRLSLHRRSARYPDSPGLKARRHPHLLIALDTSGSLATVELEQFWSAIHQIWKAGAAFSVLECDDRIRRHYRYRGQPPQAVEGRGQTLFSPPFQFLRQHPQFDGLLYFTDGYATAPVPYRSRPCLWVISAKGIDTQHPNWQRLPGEKIKLL
ncbi:MAG: VWA-like domain-containing protein [Bacteroidota bacterium]